MNLVVVLKEFPAIPVICFIEPIQISPRNPCQTNDDGVAKSIRHVAAGFFIGVFVEIIPPKV